MHLFCLGLLTMGYNGCITTCSYSDKRYSVNKNEVKKMNITKNFKAELAEAVKMHTQYNDLKTKLDTFKDKYRDQLSPDQVIRLDTGEQLKRGKDNSSKRVINNDPAIAWFNDAIKDGIVTRQFFNKELSKIREASKASMTLKQTPVA